jgi:hypothetical protein
MGDSSVPSLEIILVLCHSFFHDAFRIQRPVNEAKFKIWVSSRFVANFIIERQAELPEGSPFAVTSKQVFDDFACKFYGEKPSVKQKEVVAILRNSIYVIDHPSITKLSIDESVLVICDTLYSRSNYTPILVSNIPKKIEKAEEFYHKKDPQAKIPYPIYSTLEAEPYLRGRFPELCKLVDKRIRESEQKR